MEIKRFEVLPVLESIRLNEKIGFQITCVEVSNNDVYLGTLDSFVLCYQGVLETRTAFQPTPLYRYLTSKKPVTQLKIASVLERLLCVYDSTFIALNLNGLEVNNNLRVKNVHAFCLNENPISLEDPFSVELCLVKKKTISICHLQADKMTVVKEVTVPEQPILAAMDGYFVCFAAENNYYMLDWQSGSAQQLCSIEATSFLTPVCKHVARQEFLINGLSHLGIFVKSSGISERPPIDWGTDVKRIAYSYPYILCLKQHSIAIISVLDSLVKEEFLFENGAYIDNFDGKILIASSDSVFYLRRIPWQEQIDSLLDNGKTQEAIDLCASLYETGLISNRDFDYAKLVRVKAGLRELSLGNFAPAQQFLIESEFDIEIFLSCYKDITDYLQLEPEEGDFRGTILGEIKSKVISNPETFVPFLIAYIKELMVQNKFLYTSNASKINTCLLILYLSDISKYYAAIEKFIWSGHKFDFKCAERYLQEHSWHHLLAVLYSSRTEHYEGALELWKKLEKGQLVDLHYSGLDNICRLLRTCKNSKLVLNHIEFVLERDQNEAVEVLIANTNTAPSRVANDAFLDPEYVVGILHKYRRALITYLEFLVFTLKVKSTSIHNSLALIYIEIISIQQETEEEESTLCESILQKLNNLLETSNDYDAPTVLHSLVKNGLDYESAFLYGKLGNHMKAFEVYLGKHMDHDRALKHCCHYATQEKSNAIYGTLLNVYLDLYNKNGPEIAKPLLNLVNHSQCQFDLADTLKQLPSDWPLNTVRRFVTNCLRSTFNRHHQSSMGNVLSLSQLERLKEQKRLLLRNPIHLNKDSVCIICNNAIFDSKFVWLPTLQCFLHDFCYSDKGS